MTHNLLPKMLKEKKGNIVIVSSAASNIKGVPNRFIYGTTKAALNGFVKAIAIDHIKDGIRCNAILPIRICITERMMFLECFSSTLMIILKTLIW